MPQIGPISRRDLIANLRQLGFSGPYPGGKHEFMTKGARHVTLPNPHPGAIRSDFLLRILKHAGVTRTDWEAL